MKNKLHTGFIMAMIMIILFCISFYNYLQTKKMEQEHEKYGNLQKELLMENEDESNELPSKNVGVEDKISNNTRLTLLELESSKKRNNSPKTVDVKMNSKCLEMGFAEFRQYLEANKMEVLTEKVYELNQSYDSQTDSVIILKFSSENVILGISCGKYDGSKVKSGFDYKMIVDCNQLIIMKLNRETQSSYGILFVSEINDYYFPAEVLKSLENGIFFDSEKDLYNFLESYSS